MDAICPQTVHPGNFHGVIAFGTDLVGEGALELERTIIP